MGFKYIRRHRGFLDPEILVAIEDLFSSWFCCTTREKWLLRQYIIESIVFQSTNLIDGGFESETLNNYFSGLVNKVARVVLESPIPDDESHLSENTPLEFANDMFELGESGVFNFDGVSSVIYKYALKFGYNPNIANELNEILDSFDITQWDLSYEITEVMGGSIRRYDLQFTLEEKD